MAVRLRFQVSHKGEQKSWDARQTKLGTVKLSPVYPGNLPKDDPSRPEIEAFYNATPGGQIEFATINEDALQQFEIGDDWYVTLERVPAQATNESAGEI